MTRRVPRVGIVVLQHGRWDYTVECLEAVQRLEYEDYFTVLVDNGSPDASVERVLQWARGEMGEITSRYVRYEPAKKPLLHVQLPAEEAGSFALPGDFWAEPSWRRLVLIRSSKNVGFAAGCNLGIRLALAHGADYVWLLNNDAVPEPRSLRAMVELAEGSPGVAVVGAKLLYYEDPTRIQAAGGGRFYFWLGIVRRYGAGQRADGSWEKPFEPEYVSGASMLIRFEALRTVGPLDESFFFYAEELDWQLRARRSGWRSTYCPQAIVYHRESGTAGYKRTWAVYESTRSNLRLCKKYAPWTLPFVIMCKCLRALQLASWGRGEVAGAMIRGVLAALREGAGRRVLDRKYG